MVSDSQNCGNILAGVGAFAVERAGRSRGSETAIRIYMENTFPVCCRAAIRTANGRPVYTGDASIDGVPTPAAPVYLTFTDAAGSSCVRIAAHRLGRKRDEGVACTLNPTNGMPVVVMRAAISA